MDVEPDRRVVRAGTRAVRWRRAPAREADGERCGALARIAEREGLAEPDIGRLASPWHTDADLGRPIEVVTDMSKSRRLGFTGYQPTDDAFFALFEQLRADRLIP